MYMPPDYEQSATCLKADLHGTTLSHATSLRQACDMSQDHLHANDIFIYKIKYAKVCTGIYGAKVLTNGKKIYQLSCALKKLSNKMFFALIRSVLFEKLLMRISQQQVRPPF